MRLTIEKILVLKQIPLFTSMHENDLADMVAQGKEVMISKGDFVLKTGKVSDSLVIILQGEINVMSEGKVLKVLKAMDYFGMLFAFDPSEARYDFVANEDCLILKLDKDGLYDLISENKDFAENLIMIMCQRVKEKDRWVEL